MLRGKVMRDTNAGPGIVYVNGEQKEFLLEQHWKSGVPPKVGATVDIQFTPQGDLLHLSLVDEAEIAKEQAQKAAAAATSFAQKHGRSLVARVGAPTLGAMGLLAIAWLYLAVVHVRISADFGQSATFYDILKLANAGGNLEALASIKYGSAGMYGIFMWAALLAPLATHFHTNKHLAWGYCAPLAFMVTVGLSVYFEIKQQFSASQNAVGALFGGKSSRMMADMANEMLTMALKAISFGMGFYLALLVAVVLAAVGVKKVLVSSYNV